MKKHPDCLTECLVAAARGPLRICTDKCAYADDDTRPFNKEQQRIIDETVAEHECAHVWVSNSGAGGEPVFKLNRQMSALPIMHVSCGVCGERTWLTESQWHLLAAAQGE